MRIDQSHRSWFVATLLIAAGAGAAYIYFVMTSHQPPAGDTWVGLVLGVLSYLFILFAGSLGVRRKGLLLRIGSMSCWMKGHLWLGLLSLPLVLLHGAFAFGGMLTIVIMTLLIVIVVSGIIGAVFQHLIPKSMSAEFPNEFTFDQIGRLRDITRVEAFALVAGHCGTMPEADLEREEAVRYTGKAIEKIEKSAEQPLPGQDELKRFYVDEVRSYLREPDAGKKPLRVALRAEFMFENLRLSVDPAMHEVVQELARMCSEVRETVHQARRHRLLHVWLLVHVPLSMALLVLMTVHAVAALYY